MRVSDVVRSRDPEIPDAADATRSDHAPETPTDAGTGDDQDVEEATAESAELGPFGAVSPTPGAELWAAAEDDNPAAPADMAAISPGYGMADEEDTAPDAGPGAFSPGYALIEDAGESQDSGLEPNPETAPLEPDGAPASPAMFSPGYALIEDASAAHESVTPVELNTAPIQGAGQDAGRVEVVDAAQVEGQVAVEPPRAEQSAELTLREFNREQREGKIPTDVRPREIGHRGVIERELDLRTGEEHVRLLDGGAPTVRSLTDAAGPSGTIRSGNLSIHTALTGKVTARRLPKRRVRHQQRRRRHPFLARGERR